MRTNPLILHSWNKTLLDLNTSLRLLSPEKSQAAHCLLADYILDSEGKYSEYNNQKLDYSSGGESLLQHFLLP